MKKTNQLYINVNSYSISKFLIFLVLFMERNPIFARNNMIQWPILGIVLLFFLIELFSTDRIINDIFFLWICLFSFIVVMSVAWAYDTSRTIRDMLFLVKCIVILGHVLYIIKKDKNLTYIFDCVILSTLINDLVMLPYLLRMGSASGYRERIFIGGINYNANAICPDIVFATLFLFYRYTNLKKNRVLNIGMIMLNCFALLKLGSRSSLIVLLVGFVINGLNVSKSKRVKNIFLGCIIMIAALGAVMYIPSFYNTIGNRILDTLSFVKGNLNVNNYNQNSDLVRMNLIINGFDMFIKNPIIGYGSGNFSSVNSLFFNSNYYAHNNYIELLVGLGVFGTLLFYWIHIRIILKKYKPGGSRRIFFLGKELIICSLVLDLMDVTYNVLDFQLIILIAYVCCFIYIDDEEDFRHEKNIICT